MDYTNKTSSARALMNTTLAKDQSKFGVDTKNISHFLAEFKHKKNQSSKTRPAAVRKQEQSSPSQQLSSKVFYESMSGFRGSPTRKRVLKPSATIASIMQGPIL